jgi:hypothetical protein
VAERFGVRASLALGGIVCFLVAVTVGLRVTRAQAADQEAGEQLEGTEAARTPEALGERSPHQQI